MSRECNIKISVILPVFNKENYIYNILNDIAGQTFNYYECIIVDDGSTDNSGKICDAIAKNDNRFHVIHTKNSGASHARNTGLDIAAGEYVTFVDADDHIEPNYLEYLYKNAVETKADMVICGMKKFWISDHADEFTTVPYSGLMDKQMLLPDFASVQKSSGIFGYCCGKLIRRDLIDNIRFSEWLKLAEDFDFYLQIYPRVKTIYFDTECKYHYLQEAENSSAIRSSENIDFFSQLKLNLRYREFLKNSGHYSGSNQGIVESLLSDYAFFTVLYSPRIQVKERLHNVHELAAKEKINLTGDGFMRKILIRCIKLDSGMTAENILRLYDLLRKIKRRH